MSVCGTWVWKFLYVSVLTPICLQLLQDFMNDMDPNNSPYIQYFHSELLVETFSDVWCVLMHCSASSMQFFKSNICLVNSNIYLLILLRRVFGPERDEVTWEWRKLQNEELNDLHS